MPKLSETQRLEQGLTFVRLFGVAFSVAAIVTTTAWPSSVTERLAWITVVFFALGSMTIWGASARLTTNQDHWRLGLIAFTFDALIICSMVWIFAWETPYVTWALLILVPLEGAIRYRLPGALAAGVLGAVFFIPQSLHRAELTGETFEMTTYVFAVGLMGLMAGTTGVMAENWRVQKDAFERQALQLAEADRIKDRFLAITSHEFRGPLTAIIMGVDTVSKRRDRLTPEQLDRLLEMVSGQGNQLARLVDDLLITSQLQNHQVTLQPEWCDLQVTIDRAVDAAASKRRAHQLEVYVEPLTCVLDEARVGQVVRNLLDNAYKYSPDRTRVAITAKAENEGIFFRIADEGPGLPEDRREELFEAFSRVHETSIGKDGVGLGLYVVSQLVSAMEGRIDLKSSRNGAIFTIHLPCEMRPRVAASLGLVAAEEASG
ncbi:MAG: ATP-binding protein [Actinomycetota bacterium]|nr:ATP-binding protein [Actinomycetota bacterium]